MSNSSLHMSKDIDVTGQIWFQVSFDLTQVDSQFPLPYETKEIKNQPR